MERSSMDARQVGSHFSHNNEELELYDYLITCATVGYPKRKGDVIGIVHKALQNKGYDVEDFKRNGWYNTYNIMDRWPIFTL